MKYSFAILSLAATGLSVPFMWPRQPIASPSLLPASLTHTPSGSFGPGVTSMPGDGPFGPGHGQGPFGTGTGGYPHPTGTGAWHHHHHHHHPLPTGTGAPIILPRQHRGPFGTGPAGAPHPTGTGAWHHHHHHHNPTGTRVPSIIPSPPTGTPIIDSSPLPQPTPA